MAQDSIVGGLFGLTPEMYQRSQQAADQQEAMQFAQLSPLQQASAGFYSAGRGLGRGIGTLLGAEDPQLQMIAQQQQILRNVDPNDPESIAQGARMASEMGNPQLAMSLSAFGRDLMQKQSQIRAQTATAQKAELSVRQENELRQKLAELGPNPTNEQIVSVVSQYGAPDKVLSVLQSTADKAAAREQRAIEFQQRSDALIQAARERGDTARQIAQITADSRREIALIRSGGAEEKPLTQQQQVKLRRDYAVDESFVKSTQDTAGELERLRDSLLGNKEKGIKPHPGLGGATGWSSYLWSKPLGQARSAEQQLETLKGKVMAFGRQAATESGKLGNMAVQEWKFISDAVQKIDPASKNFPDQLNDIVRQANSLAKRQQEKFDSSYEDAPIKLGGQKSQSPQKEVNWSEMSPKGGR
jgi:hypothetical protein